MSNRTQVMFDAALQRPRGRPKGSKNKNVDNVHNKKGYARPSGNSELRALRVLREKRPDLLAYVLTYQITAHQAMRIAGFRQRTVSLPIDNTLLLAQALRRRLNDDDREELTYYLGLDAEEWAQEWAGWQEYLKPDQEELAARQMTDQQYQSAMEHLSQWDASTNPEVRKEIDGIRQLITQQKEASE